jgi:hypothetical protein
MGPGSHPAGRRHVVYPSAFSRGTAIANQLPVVYGFREHVEAGGLISYGPNFRDLYRRAAVFVDRILNCDFSESFPQPVAGFSETSPTCSETFRHSGLPAMLPPGKGVSMAYRELGMVELQEILRRWLAGDSVRAIARATGMEQVPRLPPCQ